MRLTRFAVAGIAALGLALGSVSVPATAAPVSGTGWVATPNGVVGVQQQIVVRAPKAAGQVATVTFTNPAGGTNAGQAAVSGLFAYLPWTPNLAGTWSMTASVGGKTVGSTSIVVSAVPTETFIVVPDEVQTGIAATITVEVVSLTGSIAPSGTVSVTTLSGASIASGALRPNGAPRTSAVNLSWTPAAGSTSMRATFTPATSAFGGSTSRIATPIAAGVQTISIQNTGEFYVGEPIVLQAVTGNGVPGGAAAFNQTIDGFLTYIGGSNPVVNGVASYTWTPTQTGYTTLGVQYASTNFAVNGRDSQAIFVNPAPAADAITVTPAGAAAWGQGTVGSLVAGNNVALTPSSTSGNPVTLAANGPCVINAGVLTVLGAGSCAITATSMGNGTSLAASTATYTVNVTAAPKKKKR